MKIYTRTGDEGTTSLIGGKRVSKSDVRIDAYGTIDELNACIGLLKDQPVNEPLQEFLKEIQDRLFTIGSSLAADPEKSVLKIPDIRPSDIDVVEDKIDQMNEELAPLHAFILPGGHQSISFGHITRTVCRRAERSVILLSKDEFVADLIVKYLNRLSDYLFTLCRWMHHKLNVEEQTWKART